MQLNVIRADDVMTELALVGKLDIAGVHAIDMKFHLNTAARRKPTLVDLSQLEMITSLGIGLLISCGRSLMRHGPKLVLCNPTPVVEEAMKAIGLGEAIPVAHTREEAMTILFPGGAPR
ncbi:MAG TPA: STAS domain-containing protein [Gemmataceae bacterium]|nr:STAS domain-containing protein [Gemmataceae bacterium]